jgi:hypothetical protein
MVKDPYFQFPLCALSFGQAVNERLNAIISFAVIEAGSKLWRKLPAQEREQRIEGFLACEVETFDCEDSMHRVALYGAEVIGITFYNFRSALAQFNHLRAHIDSFHARHGRDALVRVKSKWLFDARENHGLTYREFSVLCAIYSAIGDKELAIVTRERIRHCALGYRTAAIMRAELPRRVDAAQPLTERQLRDTITRLHRNKFFARCTVARRITYYSIRLDNEVLRKKVLERRTYPEFFRASQSAQDQTLTDAIKQKRRETANSEPKTPLPTPRFKFPLPGDSR